MLLLKKFMKQKAEKKILKLLNDQRFLEWIYYRTEDLDNFWNRYIQKYPAEKETIEESRIILTGIPHEDKKLEANEAGLLLERIKSSIKTQQNSAFRRKIWLYAAGFLLIIGFGSTFAYLMFSSNNNSFDYYSVASATAENDDVTLILSDNSTATIYSDNEELHYNDKGIIITSSGKVLEQADIEKKDGKEPFNQLIVPRGKRSNIILSDGTRLWLNSGSHAIYPVTFNKKKREIFIEGEAYLEVTPDANRPFHVKTSHIDIQVLGTKFNINSYSDEGISSVVLVEGSVKAIADSKAVLISPNQIFSRESQTGKTSLKSVNVLDYISWKEGWLIFKNENLGNVVSKISRYYNITIELKDEKAQKMTISGKLDLKKDYLEVVKVITTIAPLYYEIVNERIQIKMN
jgi:hypothetical protein